MGFQLKLPILIILFGIQLVLFAGPQQSQAESSVHGGISCGACHDSGSLESGMVKIAAVSRCQQCHLSTDIAKGIFHGANIDRCTNCHSFHNPNRVSVKIGNAELATTLDLSMGHCQSCHDARGNLDSLSPGHKVASELYHQKAGEIQSLPPSESCLRCHSNKPEETWRAASGLDHLDIHFHSSHPYGIKVIPGKGDRINWIANQIDDRLPLFDGKMECQTCHLLTADNEDLLIPFETKYDLCRGCHKHTGDENKNQVNSNLAELGSR